MTFYYFGYGSNMLTERLRARCPSAMCVGIAEVSDYCLEYSKKSKDCSGKATLRRTQEEGHRAFGVVFEIPKTEREKLDEAEGTKHGGYKRWDCFPVRLLDSGQYLMTSCYLANKPTSY